MHHTRHGRNTGLVLASTTWHFAARRDPIWPPFDGMARQMMLRFRGTKGQQKNSGPHGRRSQKLTQPQGHGINFRVCWWTMAISIIPSPSIHHGAHPSTPSFARVPIFHGHPSGSQPRLPSMVTSQNTSYATPCIAVTARTACEEPGRSDRPLAAIFRVYEPVGGLVNTDQITKMGKRPSLQMKRDPVASLLSPHPTTIVMSQAKKKKHTRK